MRAAGHPRSLNDKEPDMTSKPLHLCAIVLAAVSAALAFPGGAGAQTRSAEPFRWDGALAPGATLEIKGVNGPVRATAAAGSTARVEAVRSGRRNDPTEVEIVVVPHPGGVTVCALYPGNSRARNECRPGNEGRNSARNNDVQVEFIVAVPAGVDLVARTTNGSVTAQNVTGRVEAYSTNGEVRVEGASSARARTTNGSVVVRSAGDADVSTTNGRITAHLGDLGGGAPLRFATTNGSIDLTLTPASGANIEAATANGRIRSELPLTVQGAITRNRLTGTIGAGGRTIELRTTNGSISIRGGL
jgi:hypothetical protein